MTTLSGNSPNGNMSEGVSSAERQTDVDPISSTIAIQTFDDTVAVVRDKLDVVQVSNLSEVDPYVDMGLSFFLTRQFLLSEFTWSPTALSVSDLDIPGQLFSASENFFRDKLSMFCWFRAGVKFVIRINGTRYHYGRLIFWWHPTDDYNYGSAVETSPYQGSTFPHVVVSASSTETHELEVPFSLPSTALSLQRYTSGQMGSFRWAILNGLRLSDATTPAPINVTIYASFVNPEVWGLATVALGTPPAAIEPHSGRRLGQRFTPEQVSKSKQGVIGSIAENIRTISGRLLGIPIVGGAAGVVNVVSSAVQSVADYFGYNKPTTLAAVQPMRLNLTGDMPSGSGVDNSVKLAFEPGNAVATDSSLVLSDPEDMGLTPLAMIPSLLTQFDWTPLQAPGKLLMEIAVDPKSMYSGTVVSDINKNTAVLGLSVIPTIVATVAIPFKYWRGSLKYKIQFTASMFHTGRLRIEYVPAPAWSTPTDVADFNALSRVVDINNDAEIYFTVPFMHDRVWSDGLIGFLRFRVMNPLLAQGGVNAPVSINVFVAAGEDMQFAALQAMYLVGTDEIVQALQVTPPSPEIEPHSMTRTEFREKSFQGFHPSAHYSVDTGICIGEVLSSIRTVLHRYYLTWYLPTASGGDSIEYAPWLKLGEDQTNGETVYSPTFDLTGTSYEYTDDQLPQGFTYNPYYHFRRLFMYWRGSHRSKVVVPTQTHTAAGIASGYTTTLGVVQNFRNAGFFKQTSATSDFLLGASSSMGMIQTVNAYAPILEAEIPYYNNQVLSIVEQSVASSTSYYDTAQANFRCTFANSFAEPAQTAFVYTAVGDDFSLGFVKGPGDSYVVAQNTARCPGQYLNAGGFGSGTSAIVGATNVPFLFPYHYTEPNEVATFGRIPSSW